MTDSYLLKVTVSISIVSLLSACSSFQHTGVFNQTELAEQNVGAHFARTLQNEAWLADEYRTYLSKKGNKAFAVYWDGAGRPVASGFGDDKLSIELARGEALRLCQAYSQSDQKNCILEDEEISHRAAVDTTKYPKEVIAYRDIEHWQDYVSTSGHKAIAGNRSGIQGGGEGKTRQEAEFNALSQCKANAHFSMRNCYIIASE